MTRAFTHETVPSELVDTLVDSARRAPAAGNSASAEFLVFEGPEQVASYWDVALPPERRDSFQWPDLLSAPVLVVVFVDPGAYVSRYGEPDKAATGLGESEQAWSTPYWWVDGGMAAMTILLAVEEAGLGALFFGLFGHEQDVKRRFGVPPQLRAIGVVAIGNKGPEQRRSGSLVRGRPPLADVIHRSSWNDPSH